MEEQLADFIELHVGLIQPLVPALIAGDLPGLHARRAALEARPKLAAIFASRMDYGRIRACYRSAEIRNPLLRRHAVVLFGFYVRFQTDQELADSLRAAELKLLDGLERFRAKTPKGPVDLAGVMHFFRTSSAAKAREVAWENLLALSEDLAAAHLELAALRNRAAREQEFRDHLELTFTLHEIDTRALEEQLKKLADLTSAALTSTRKRLERDQARVLKLTPRTLRPWHFRHPFMIGAAADEEILVREEATNAAKRLLVHVGLETKEGAPRKKSVPRDADSAEWIASVGAGLCPLLAAHTHSLQSELPPLLRRLHPIIAETVRQLILDELRDPKLLVTALGMSGPRAQAAAKSFAVDLRQNRLLVSRMALAFLDFEEHRYRHPGEDLSARFRFVLESAGIAATGLPNDRPAWAALPGFIDPIHSAHIQALGMMAAAQVRLALVGSNEKRSLFLDTKLRHRLIAELLGPGLGRAWYDTITAISGHALSEEALARRLNAP